MAGTSDDFSIGEEWPLLCDVRAFVTRYCKTETAAQELLLEFARKGHFKRYRWYAPDAQRCAISSVISAHTFSPSGSVASIRST